ncbi:cell surface protein [Mucinivorans hirudinis]|uniref:Cell surface protein n=1 Tax=Mucinivorans hirudinis TaxID=1433126 RepID=A0A060R7W1_9BACT|nr:cell surface protein [Mucinivorans hirudinis]
MKKLLLFMGAVALLASCNKQLDTQTEEKMDAKGIVFSADLGTDTKAQFDPFETPDKAFFWYAEEDQIKIFYNNAEISYNPVSQNTSGYKDNFRTFYKATRSALNGVFTATGYNWLWFLQDGAKNQSKKASFRAVWPTSVVVDANVENATLPYYNTTVEGGSYYQNNVEGSLPAQNMFMWAEQVDYVASPFNNNCNNVTNNLKLTFERPYTAMVFRTENYDGYKDFLGDLLAVKLETMGKKKADGTIVKDPSLIFFGTSATYNFKDKVITTSADASPISLISKWTSWQWKDDAKLYLPINSVKRDFTEKYEVTYLFQNVELNKKYETSNNWPKTYGNFVKAPVLDIKAEPYIVTNGPDRSLIVNSGNLANTLNSAKTAVVWNGVDVDFTEFENIVIYSAQNDANLALLKKFTQAEIVSIELVENIPAQTFNGMTSLKKVVLPNVVTIANNAFPTGLSLETVVLPKWTGNTQLENNNTFARLFNKVSLKYADLSALTKIGEEFNTDFISFRNFNKLEEIKLKDGIVVNRNAFYGATNLDKVNAKVDLINAQSAFYGCSALTEIEILGSIGAQAFQGSSIKNVTGVINAQAPSNNIGDQAFEGVTSLEKFLVTGYAEVGFESFKGCTKLVEVAGQPIKVGVSAFEDCNKLPKLDVSKLTTIGVSAFKGTTLFKNTTGNTGLVFDVLTAIPASAFEGNGASVFHFKAVTSITGANALNAPNASQMKFDEKFTISDVQPFGTTTNVTLWINKGMRDNTSGTTIQGNTLKWSTSKSAKFISITNN